MVFNYKHNTNMLINFNFKSKKNPNLGFELKLELSSDSFRFCRNFYCNLGPLMLGIGGSVDSNGSSHDLSLQCEFVKNKYAGIKFSKFIDNNQLSLVYRDEGFEFEYPLDMKEDNMATIGIWASITIAGLIFSQEKSEVDSM